MLLLLSIFVLACFTITLIIGLMNAARRADEGEERILKIISLAEPNIIKSVPNREKATVFGAALSSR